MHKFEFQAFSIDDIFCTYKWVNVNMNRWMDGHKKNGNGFIKNTQLIHMSHQ